MKTIEGGWPKEAKFEPTFLGYEYTDQDSFRKEVEQIWMKTWLLAGRIEEVPNVGDYFTIQLEKESLICMRTQEGSIQTYYNVCMHRGSRLCEEGTGNMSKGYITCPYHSWMYDGETGKLLSAPNIPRETEEFSCEKVQLHSVRTEIWDGYIWINMDPNAPSLEESFRLPESWSIYEKYDMKNLRIGSQKTYTVHANWKLLMENASECYHCGNIHPELSRVTPPNRPRQWIDKNIPDTEVLKHVGAMELKPGLERVNLDGKAYRPPFPNLKEEDVSKIYYLHFFPHSYICMASDYVFVAAMWPIDVDKTIVKGYWLFTPEVLENKEPIQDAIDIWDITSKEDWEACEWAQQGNESRVYESGGILTPIDWRVAKFKHYVHKKLEEPF
ncbi:aromatic ring-hydroxylating oxygenase subunit alpha [Alteribacillus bidgolensis]|uniref:Rieske 2Fe-2S family protein n=1 Tax=Alteribacillus bidgolensis TaxID=930129 RepID=A0A1G8ECL7_9BACI|nr:aromatic ring-hydroxylating dioxygenase subunit alpha [Alteribacillus bidgolensis]SDH67608.1 Rieske 2Fe-2S family protein [Alteribacillus bidgolensis]